MTHLAAFLQHECHRLIPQKMRDGKDILNNGLGMIWRMGFQRGTEHIGHLLQQAPGDDSPCRLPATRMPPAYSAEGEGWKRHTEQWFWG
ncbi:hypothetical protein CG435_09100 [Pantoea ananatis]|nr:hypothetical protein CG435_09100 [Pantoea ananatis]